MAYFASSKETFFALERLSAPYEQLRTIVVQQGSRERTIHLSIPEGSPIINLHFSPNGYGSTDRPKSRREIVGNMRAALDELPELIEALKASKAKYVQGGTSNKELADMAIRHAGMHGVTEMRGMGDGSYQIVGRRKDVIKALERILQR